jgi:hypothetical protein
MRRSALSLKLVYAAEADRLEEEAARPEEFNA